MTREATLSGGCQCGAVRFCAGRLGRPSICHCRMCQKAFGSFYGPFVTAHELTWTRGMPKYFASSDKVRRGFCAECGTPLTYEPIDAAREIAIGALDDPMRAEPVIQVNAADKLPFADRLHALPTRKAEEAPAEQAFMAALTNYQHPDHDTAQWPPERAR